MTNLNYNNQAISQREDNYVNATEMCKATNKKVNDWLRLKATIEYKQALSVDTGIPVTLLIDSSDKGTFVHPLLALQIGRWVSPQFAIWCDTHIKTLMETGETKLEQPLRLPPSVELKVKVSERVEYLATTTDLPEHMRQIMMDDLFNSTFTQPVLPEDRPLMLGAVQRAEELGYKVDNSTRIKLGQQLAKWAELNPTKLIRTRESRLCNGTMRKIWCYEVNEYLDKAIKQFFR